MTKDKMLIEFDDMLPLVLDKMFIGHRITKLPALRNNRISVSLMTTDTCFTLSVATERLKSNGTAHAKYPDCIYLDIHKNKPTTLVDEQVRIRQWLSHQICVRSLKTHHLSIAEKINRLCVVKP